MCLTLINCFFLFLFLNISRHLFVSKGKEIVKERGGILVPIKSREEIRLSVIYILPCDYISPLAADTLKNAQRKGIMCAYHILPLFPRKRA